MLPSTEHAETSGDTVEDGTTRYSQRLKVIESDINPLQTHPVQLPADMIPTRDMLFDSQDAACAFMNEYAKESGFSLRRGKVEYSKTKPDEVRKRTLLCNSEG